MCTTGDHCTYRLQYNTSPATLRFEFEFKHAVRSVFWELIKSIEKKCSNLKYVLCGKTVFLYLLFVCFCVFGKPPRTATSQLLCKPNCGAAVVILFLYYIHRCMVNKSKNIMSLEALIKLYTQQLYSNTAVVTFTTRE